MYIFFYNLFLFMVLSCQKKVFFAFFANQKLKQKLKMRIWLRVEDPYIFLQLFITL